MKPHLLPLELLALAQQLDQQARALQVVPQPLPVLQLLFGRLNLLVVLSLRKQSEAGVGRSAQGAAGAQPSP